MDILGLLLKFKKTDRNFEVNAFKGNDLSSLYLLLFWKNVQISKYNYVYLFVICNHPTKTTLWRSICYWPQCWLPLQELQLSGNSCPIGIRPPEKKKLSSTSRCRLYSIIWLKGKINCLQYNLKANCVHPVALFCWRCSFQHLLSVYYSGYLKGDTSYKYTIQEHAPSFTYSLRKDRLRI